MKKVYELGEYEGVDVALIIVTVYGLPHFGKDLKEIVATKEKSAEATYREKSFNVSAGAHWNRHMTGKKKQPIASRTTILCTKQTKRLHTTRIPTTQIPSQTPFQARFQGPPLHHL